VDPPRDRRAAGLVGKLADRFAQGPIWGIWISITIATWFLIRDLRDGATHWAILDGVLLALALGLAVTAIVVKARRGRGPRSN
jgi:hypothetical protein